MIERLGPYRIIGRLGKGGMGTVYEAVNLETGEPAAVKLLSDALAEEEGFRNRFEAEIETLRKLNHPNIVRLFGFGQQDAHIFYAMELIDGNSLEEEISRGRSFDSREVVRIVIELCHALRHAHDRGVIHRDIKPGNLLLTSTGQVKLSDFGIARLFGNTRLTAVGSVLGTAEYMAPEQAAGKPVDQRADLYSLGVVMYVLLARRPVFPGKSLSEVLYKQQFETPQPLRPKNNDVPEELDRIILQLLEKDPARRISNATILGRCLEAMQHALPLPAETILADESYYQAQPPETQIFIGNLQSAAVSADPQSASDLPQTVPDAAVPSPKTTDSDAKTNTASNHFVQVRGEELDRGEMEKPRHPIISLHTWGLVVGLLLLGLGIWYFLQAPSADALYGRIDKQIANYAGDKKIDSLLPAEEDIQAFLDRYPHDSRAARLRNYQREIELYWLDRKFELRLKGLAQTENLRPIERAYLDAIDYTRYGPEQRAARLQALIELFENRGENAATTGGCLTLAHRRLEQLNREIRQRADEQLEIIEKRLDEAGNLLSSDPKHAAAMYRAAIELYSDKPWAAHAVRRAQAGLDKVKANL